MNQCRRSLRQELKNESSELTGDAVDRPAMRQNMLNFWINDWESWKRKSENGSGRQGRNPSAVPQIELEKLLSERKP